MKPRADEVQYQGTPYCEQWRQGVGFKYNDVY